MNKRDPLLTAQTIFHHRFKDAQVFIASGSIFRGEGTAFSDIDVVILYEKLPQAYRDSFIFEGYCLKATKNWRF